MSIVPCIITENENFMYYEKPECCLHISFVFGKDLNKFLKLTEQLLAFNRIFFKGKFHLPK